METDVTAEKTLHIEISCCPSAVLNALIGVDLGASGETRTAMERATLQLGTYPNLHVQLISGISSIPSVGGRLRSSSIANE